MSDRMYSVPQAASMTGKKTLSKDDDTNPASLYVHILYHTILPKF